MAKIISGKEVSSQMQKELTEKVKKFKVKPRLAIVQVGNREDSNVYIRQKIKFTENIGGSAQHLRLPKSITQQELVKKLEELNNDNSIHGIIVQLPFDSDTTIDSAYITNVVAPEKDVDGLSNINAGKLLHGQADGNDNYLPCTPNGCIELINRAGYIIAGSRAVVLGRSKIVGSPMAQLLIWNNATVTVIHSKSKNVPEILREADIVVAAIGQPEFVKKEWIKPGACVIDCGISAVPDPTKKSGQRLVGDVDYENVKEVAGAITPVPGGVGPMTVAMLIKNTVDAAEKLANQENDST